MPVRFRWSVTRSTTSWAISLGKLRLGYISYLNSLVFYHNLDSAKYDLVDGTPSSLMRRFSAGEIDACLMPVAGVNQLGDEVKVVGRLGIAVKSQARSVILFSKYEADQLDGKKLAITDQTVTSRRLLTILLEKHWHSNPELVEAGVEADAELIIGDAALRALKRSDYQYRYDLAEEWHRMCGLPFVFALWVVRKGVTEAAREELNRDLERNLAENMGVLERIVPEVDFVSKAEALSYIRNFSYVLDEDDFEGLKQFTNYCG